MVAYWVASDNTGNVLSVRTRPILTVYQGSTGIARPIRALDACLALADLPCLGRICSKGGQRSGYLFLVIDLPSHLQAKEVPSTKCGIGDHGCG